MQHLTHHVSVITMQRRPALLCVSYISAAGSIVLGLSSVSAYVCGCIHASPRGGSSGLAVDNCHCQFSV